MQKGGFFNSLMVNGSPDRKYNADHYSDNLAAFISDGVRYGKNNDLYVSALGGMALNIAVGRAMIKGHWFYNDTAYTSFSVPTAHPSLSRVDRIVVRFDNNVSAREITFKYLTGVPAATPIAPALTRDENIYDIAIADITVGAAVTSITQSNITDQRANRDVCGWVTLANDILFKRYQERITVTEAGKQFTFNIPQYNPDGADILEVYVNGILEIEGKDFTASDRVLTFINSVSLIVGTEIDVVVYKSIVDDGVALFSGEITELQNKINTLGDVSDYNYICKGLNDNIALSNLAQTFLAGADDGKTMTVHIYGNLAIGAPYAGEGTSTSRYRYFSFGTNATTSRRIIFDFENCSRIAITCGAGTHNIIFYGVDCHIKNLNLSVSCPSDATCEVFSSTNGEVTAELCCFYILGYTGCLIAETGTFTNCYGTVVNTDNSYCFNVNTNGLLRLICGEFYAYTRSNTENSAVVYISSTATSGAAVLYGVNCPTVAVTGRYQKYAVKQLAGNVTSVGLVTGLTVSNTVTNLGQIARSKEGRL